MTDFTVLVAPIRREDGTHGDDASAVQVRWDPTPPTLSPKAAAHMQSRWSAYLEDARALHKTLFNGPITRLVHARRRPTIPGQPGTIELVLGPADYMTFLVAHLRDRPWFQAHAPEVSAAALGNSVLLTSGGRALLGIRSAQVSAYAQHAHLLGGVLEQLEPGQIHTGSAEPLIAHLLKELSEEAGITETDLQPRHSPDSECWPRFLGIARDEFLAQPEAIWHWEVQTPLATIAQRLSPQEHAGAVEVTRAHPSPDLWQCMTPVARHTWRLWSNHDVAT